MVEEEEDDEEGGAATSECEGTVDALGFGLKPGKLKKLSNGWMVSEGAGECEFVFLLSALLCKLSCFSLLSLLLRTNN